MNENPEEGNSHWSNLLQVELTLRVSHIQHSLHSFSHILSSFLHRGELPLAPQNDPLPPTFSCGWDCHTERHCCAAQDLISLLPCN